MAFTLTLPENYNYVLAVPLILVPILGTAHYLVCGHRRHSSGVPYPYSYATVEQATKSPNAYKFNCAQRAQTNFNEHALYVALSTLAAGLQYPKVAATLGLIWGIGRSVYLWGYTTKGPKARNYGLFHTIGEIGLLLLGIYSAGKTLALF